MNQDGIRPYADYAFVAEPCLWKPELAPPKDAAGKALPLNACVSFRATTQGYTNYYLRHKGYWLNLEQRSDDLLFKQDASFNVPILDSLEITAVTLEAMTPTAGVLGYRLQQPADDATALSMAYPTSPVPASHLFTFQRQACAKWSNPATPTGIPCTRSFDVDTDAELPTSSSSSSINLSLLLPILLGITLLLALASGVLIHRRRAAKRAAVASIHIAAEPEMQTNPATVTTINNDQVMTVV